MNFQIVAVPGAEHQLAHALAMQDGLARHGIDAGIVPPHFASRHDVSICWGWRIGSMLRELGSDVLVMERGYIGDRMQWTSLGWNGLNGRAKFPTGDRARFWRHFDRELRPVAQGGSYALIIGQVPGDTALAGMDIHEWAAATAAHVRQIFPLLPVQFRPHPIEVDNGVVRNINGTRTITGSLDEALDGARVVITWNSTAGVNALLRGRPTVAMDEGSMAWPVAAHSLCIEIPVDRDAWAERLAWCQWTLEEIRSGEAWAVVKDVPR